MKMIAPALAAMSLCVLSGSASAAPDNGAVKNIVLVHGAFVDGSGWVAVTKILQKDGYTVSVVQEPETSVPDDVAATKLVIDQQDGPVVLVGHSYGGAVITEAGNDPKVVRLVYAAAFAPDEGQTLMQLNESKPAKAGKYIRPIGGFLFVDPSKFPEEFAAGLPLPEAQFMAISQVGEAVNTTVYKFPSPAWKSKPTWGIVATEDHMISPDLEREMYARAHAKVSEVKSSHAVYMTEPQAVADVIEEAARAPGK